MISLYYFTNKALQVEFNINLDSHHINHANSILVIEPNFPEFGKKIRYIIKFQKRVVTI